eukprot:6197809-Pleurochrysis_carterae.AAC.4
MSSVQSRRCEGAATATVVHGTTTAMHVISQHKQRAKRLKTTAATAEPASATPRVVRVSQHL